jgi:hypothetical protein
MTRIEELRNHLERSLSARSEDYCADCAWLLGLVDEAYELLRGDEPWELSTVTPWLAKYRERSDDHNGDADA